MQKHK